MGKRKKPIPRRTRRTNRRTPAREWIGGRLNPPFFITEDEPRRVEMYLWIELPEGVVVGTVLLDPSTPPVSFGESLQNAMHAPMIGPPRRPDRIRVADGQLADELRHAVPNIDVVIGATPEFDALVGRMIESISEGEELNTSYFDGGRIREEAVEDLFVAAKLLYTIAPWKVAMDADVLRLDIPRLGVEGACVSIIGAMGESLGFIIFPSHVAYERFLAAAEVGMLADDREFDLGTSTLALNYEHATDLPPQMRREAATHGWPVANPSAYPWVQHRDRDGTPRPLTARDVAIVTACAISLCPFFLKNKSSFESGSHAPVCESFVDNDDLEVRFTLPYEAADLFDVHGARKGRSGTRSRAPIKPRRTKKQPSRTPDQIAESTHELDDRLVHSMYQFASEEFPGGFKRAAKTFASAVETMSLFVPWSVFHVELDGKTVADWYLEHGARRLSRTERNWLNAQRAGWLSIWEVTAVDPGSRVTLRDLLTGERRTIVERTASKTLVLRDAILGRIVDYEQLSLLCGLHPQGLPPRAAADVVRRVRGRLRRKSAVPVERLRADKITRYMIKRWEEAVADLKSARTTSPRLQNTDGEELLLTVDHFAFPAAARDAIERELAGLEGVEPPAQADEKRAFVFTREGNAMHGHWENTVIGRAELGDGTLRVETNSAARADVLRTRLEAACGDRIRHRAREHSDPIASVRNPAMRTVALDDPLGVPSGDADAIVREMKARHYADWPDHPLPALKGKTPRQAARTRAGREELDVMLRDMENHEARLPAGQRFDHSELRRELGLELH